MSFMDEFQNGGSPGISSDRLNEPFHLKSMTYDSGNDEIDLTFGRGRAIFLDTVVEKNVDSTYSITTPIINTTYYVYLKSDGSYTHNTTGISPTGALKIWSVATGGTVNVLTKTDLRALIDGSGKVAQDNLDMHLAAPKYSEKLTQFASIFKMGTGKNPAGQDVDVFPSVENGKISGTAKGRTATNILDNTVAGCEATTGWNASNITIATDSSDEFEGTNCLKVTLNAGKTSGSAYRDILSLLDTTKYYFISAHEKNNNLSTGTELRMNLVGDVGFIDASTINSSNYLRQGLVIQPSDFDTATEARIYLQVYGAETEYGFFDAIMINEISASEYAEGADVLLQKYNWHLGTKSTNHVRLKAVGKNLVHNGNGEEGLNNWLTTTDATLTYDGSQFILTTTAINKSAYTERFVIDATESHMLSAKIKSDGVNSVRMYVSYYDASGAFISNEYSSTIANTFATVTKQLTIPSGTKEIGVTIYNTTATTSYFKEIQLEIGSTATTYESYKESPRYYTRTYRSLPNLVKDTIDDDGTETLRVSDDYVLQSGDITGLVSGTNLQRVVIPISTFTNIATLTSAIEGKFRIDGFPNETDQSNYDTVGFENYFATDGTNLLILKPLGTYADLATAQTDLVATKATTLNYQLQSEIKTQLSLPIVQSFEKGTVIVDLVIKEQLTYNATTGNGIDITDTNYKIDSLESVDKIEFTENGEVRTPISLGDCTIAGDGLSFTLTGASDGELYEFVRFYPKELGTLPEIEASYPLNINATIQDNNAMILKLNKNDVAQDFALDYNQGHIDNLRVDLDAHEAAADPHPQYAKQANGSYTGDGVTSRTINIGFTPKAIYIWNKASDTGYWLSFDGQEGYYTSYPINSESGTNILSGYGKYWAGIVTNGFNVGQGTGFYQSMPNGNGVIYDYYAVG